MVESPLIDTHSHLFSEEFDEDQDQVIERCYASGVKKVLLPNIDETTVDRMLSLCDKEPDLFRPMIGLHPSSVESDYVDKLTLIEEVLRRDPHRFVAIGEIGLDYYWSTEYKVEMNIALRQQLEWAAEYDLPVSLHARDAIMDTIKAIKEVGEDRLRGVFHSFTGDRHELEEILKLRSFMVGVNGVATFKKSPLGSLFVDLLPLDRIVLETDAPYLAPTPKRGRRNESSFLSYILDFLSQQYGVDRAVMAHQFFVNSSKMFNLADAR